jgi:hypothetical protein
MFARYVLPGLGSLWYSLHSGRQDYKSELKIKYRIHECDPEKER